MRRRDAWADALNPSCLYASPHLEKTVDDAVGVIYVNDGNLGWVKDGNAKHLGAEYAPREHFRPHLRMTQDILKLLFARYAALLGTNRHIFRMVLYP